MTHPPSSQPPEAIEDPNANVLSRAIAALEEDEGRTPPDPTPVPEADESGAHDLNAPAYYLSRELTWLNFNYRVLREAADERTPLLERVKFASIVSANIDEFFMKRIGGLKQQVGAGLQDRSIDGRTPLEQIEVCVERVRDLEQRKLELMGGLEDLLAAEGIELRTFEELDRDDRAWARRYYVENIYPLVTPQATDSAHPFPFISNLSMNLLVALRHPGAEASSLARVKVPVGHDTPRFLEIGSRGVFVPMEGVMAHSLDLLFPGMEIDSCSYFRVTRNANTEVDEERAEDLLAMIESELRERKFAPVVRLEISADMPAHLRGLLSAELGLDERVDLYEVNGLLGMRDLAEIAAQMHPELHDPAHHPADHPDFEVGRNVFHILRDAGALLVHHPYQSFGTTVERFLHEASIDPKVRAIKACLYRTSASSAVVDTLVAAARHGKQVAVVVELKARFDEEANIRWASRLEEAGVHVTYGVVGLKTHCKIILVVRQDYDGLRRYVHVGTGNYHAETARIYSDFGYFTCHKKIGADVTELLNYLTTGFKPRRRYHKILPSPKLLISALLEKIEREVELHSPESPGRIQIKTNALEDPKITRALYRASQAGVRVDLIVRDTCRLRPGIPGLSETVRVVSVVGRFLEHSRVYFFNAGGKGEYYVGSADCMKRNLSSRVEVLAPVAEPELRETLRFVLDTQLEDQRSAWVMQPDGSYIQRVPQGEKDAAGSQQTSIAWAEKRALKARRLRTRKPRGVSRRNLR